MLCFHFYLVPGIFSFLSWFLLWPSPHSVINELLNLHEFIHSLEFRLLPILSLLHNFKIGHMQLFQTIIVSQHVVYFRKSSTCCLLEWIFLVICVKFSVGMLGPFDIRYHLILKFLCFCSNDLSFCGRCGVIHLILLVCVITGLCFDSINIFFMK